MEEEQPQILPYNTLSKRQTNIPNRTQQHVNKTSTKNQ